MSRSRRGAGAPILAVASFLTLAAWRRCDLSLPTLFTASPAPAPRRSGRSSSLRSSSASSEGPSPRMAMAASLSASPVLLTAVAVIAGTRRQRRERAVRIACAAEGESSSSQSPDEALAEARAAAEAAKLELEAAQLRAEAEQLERTVAAQKRTSRASRLMMGVEAGSLNLEQLQSRLLEVEGMKITEEQAQAIFRACNQDVSAGLRFEDLSSEVFEKKLVEQMAGVRAETQRQQQAEYETDMREAKERREKLEREGGSSEGEYVMSADENDSRDANTRIFSILVYLLPLCDSIQFIFPLVQQVPVLGLILAPLAIGAQILNIVPFGQLIVFLAFITLAQQKNLSRLLRFNLEQAVLLDIFSFIPGLILAALSFSGGASLVPILGALFFFIQLAAVIYCWITISNGEYPEDIPFISATTKNVIDRSSFF